MHDLAGLSRRGAGPGFLAVALGLLASLSGGAAAPPRFRKLSEHYFYLAGTGGSGNVGALVTEDGVLLVDTPAEGDVAAALEALRRVTPKPVRWLVNTDRHPEHTGGNAYFLAHNALLVGRREPVAPAEPRGLRLTFDSQMRLFPGGVEARILAAGHQRVQRCAGGRFGRARRLPGKQPRLQSGPQVEDVVADRNPAARRAAGWAEHARREVLDREFWMILSRGDPARAPRIMGFVDSTHGSFPMAHSLVARLQPIGIILHSCGAKRDAKRGSTLPGGFRADPWRRRRVRRARPISGEKAENQGERERRADDGHHRQRGILR